MTAPAHFEPHHFDVGDFDLSAQLCTGGLEKWHRQSSWRGSRNSFQKRSAIHADPPPGKIP
jgi:hypothetical protein